MRTNATLRRLGCAALLRLGCAVLLRLGRAVAVALRRFGCAVGLALAPAAVGSGCGPDLCGPAPQSKSGAAAPAKPGPAPANPEQVPPRAAAAAVAIPVPRLLPSPRVTAAAESNSFFAFRSGVRAIALSPKGDRGALVSGDGREVLRFSRNGAGAITVLEPLVLGERQGRGGVLVGGPPMHSVAYSPDGVWLAAGGDAFLYWYDAPSGEMKFKVLWAAARLLTFSRDGKLLIGLEATPEGEIVRVYDMVRDNTVARLPITSPVRALAVSPDNRTLIALVDGPDWRGYRRWTLEPQPEVAGLVETPPGERPVCAVFTADGARVMVACGSGRVYEYPTATSVQQHEYMNRPDLRAAAARLLGRPVCGAAPGGVEPVVLAGVDGTIELRRPGATAFQTYGSFDRPIEQLAISHDGRVLAIAGPFPERVTILSIDEWLPYRFDFSSSAPLSVVAFAGDGALVAGGPDGRLRRFAFALGREQAPAVAAEGRVFAVAATVDGRWAASAGTGGEIVLVNVADGRPSAALTGGSAAWYESVAFGADGRLLAAGGDDGSLLLWDVSGITGVQAPAAAVGQGARSRSQPLEAAEPNPAAGAPEPPVVSIDPALPRIAPVLELRGHTDAVTALAFAPDHAVPASGSADGTVRLWDAPAPPIRPARAAPAGEAKPPVRAERRRLASTGCTIRAVGWTVDPTGIIAVRSDGRVDVVRLDGAAGRVQQIGPPGDPVRAAAVSPDGRRVVLVTRSDRLRAAVFGAAEAVDLPAPPWPVQGLAFSADGRWVAGAAGRADGTPGPGHGVLRLWRLHE